MGDFLIDDQTNVDLQLYAESAQEFTIYACFDHTTTTGGKQRLKAWFRHPTTDLSILQRRSDGIRFFTDAIGNLCFEKEPIDFIEFYLSSHDRPKRYSFFYAVKKVVKYQYAKQQERYNKQRGISEILTTLVFLKNFCLKIKKEHQHEFIDELYEDIEYIFKDPVIHKCVQAGQFKQKGLRLERCDFLIRKTYIQKIRKILSLVYDLDAFFSVALTAQKLNLCFPEYTTCSDQKLELEGVFHPFLNEAVPNNFSLGGSQHLCFLTGVNMSGKSTLMKSVAIAVYLAHVGFPVPAKKMVTGMFNGLLTTINLGDDLKSGSSHFYNEVLRLKYVAQQITTHRKLLIIFDELFRGTNVKDAYESSLLVIEAFSKIPTSFFIVSSHLVEVAQDLSKTLAINYQCFETTFRHDRPIFNYQLKKGVTTARIGAWIIANEGIVKVLNQAAIT
ncbi:hypothetical protein H8S90_10400 [Olivibacter sp. SDN3]|uniref:MutS-related protein n=1 Tax=Olivibacter sp. SDN3 TaxID=2764720 RepID=UPI001651A37E|nr:hypothetical protein [Olivibacter sp. SDN3]QNL51944.1 hypothetical protein H8S90_10400 [Olivibacter sp. SDN3]